MTKIIFKLSCLLIIGSLMSSKSEAEKGIKITEKNGKFELSKVWAEQIKSIWQQKMVRTPSGPGAETSNR